MPERLALLTNFIPPYRLPVYKILAKRFNKFKVFISTKMEPNRPWPTVWEDLQVTVQRTITLNRNWCHPHGFTDQLYVHIPYDTILHLWRYQPQVVISAEMGLRTLQAAIYRMFNPKSRLIVWALLSGYTEQNRGRLRKYLRRWLLRRIDVVLVTGKSGASYLKSFGVPDEKIFLLPQTTDISAFSFVPPVRKADQSHRLLYVGQLIERKGLVPFLTVLSLWAKAHSEQSLEFWVAGDGPLRPVLEQMTLPPNVLLRFLGNVAYEKLPLVYAQSGIFVFPTLSDEWGLVVNEAMAAGLPILGSIYSQAVEELLEEGVHGWTYRADKPDEMYRALDRALCSPVDLLDRMRVASREKVFNITPEDMAARIMLSIDYSLMRC